MKKLFSFLLMFLFGMSLINAQDLSELKAKVQALNDKFAEEMLAGNMDSMWDYYDENVISMPSYEPMLKGTEALKQSHEQMMAAGVKMTAFKTTVTDIMKSGDFVIDIGTYEITMSLPMMEEPWSDHGKYMTVWEMQGDGSLKVKAETWNTDTNPWMEMQMMEGHEAPEGHMEMENDEK